MNRQVMFEMQLLRAAVGYLIAFTNVEHITLHQNVEHITLPEIWDWLDDILGMMEVDEQ